MAAISTQKSGVLEQNHDAQIPLLLQISMMTWRNLVVMFRTPEAVIPAIIISVFFLFVYEASLGNAANSIPGLTGTGYLAFILPVSVISASLSGSGIAGQSLVRDIENGYFDKLLLTPVSRGALLLGPILAGAIILALQSIIVMGVGLLMGLNPVTGVGGLLAVLVYSLLIGTGFAGLTVGIALRTGNAAATQSSGFLFFPLTFLTATFVPIELLGGWLKVAATINPITYVLDAMRSVLLTGWDADVLLTGLQACAVMGIIPFIFALTSLQARTRRK